MEQYNRQIPTITTFRDALHFVWVIIDREAKKLEESDIHQQNLSCNHRQAIEVLKTVYLLDVEKVNEMIDIEL